MRRGLALESYWNCGLASVHFLQFLVRRVVDDHFTRWHGVHHFPGTAELASGVEGASPGGVDEFIGIPSADLSGGQLGQISSVQWNHAPAPFPN